MVNAKRCGVETNTRRLERFTIAKLTLPVRGPVTHGGGPRACEGGADAAIAGRAAAASRSTAGSLTSRFSSRPAAMPRTSTGRLRLQRRRVDRPLQNRVILE